MDTKSVEMNQDGDGSESEMPDDFRHEVVSGDIVRLAKSGKFDVVVHGCNCFCTMGAGVARVIKEHFHAAWVADRRTARGARRKLGTLSVAKVFVRGRKELVIVNAYTQYRYGRSGRFVDLEALDQCFERIATMFRGKHILFPRIGAGYGGGDFEQIKAIIDERLACCHTTLVVHSPAKQ